ncbi:hypothetical protein [Kitasatospora phosalacinea]|uniref:Uncharacterized protein n=1 Tax=Kitasatospora phosalacinea TaxID=2065 RepID=A0A9W6UTG7_9ACTN|nr:hypothetical protein [Kitasatospora phosalacinea]GLW58590.1 hypothetical protein Kpho01_66010 [Kitasatospora phosalacinea]
MNDPSYYPLLRPAPSWTIGREAVERPAVDVVPAGGGAPPPEVPDRAGPGTGRFS